jgi:small nuclear ribonucleoprotein (snRNP)-like protein
MSDYVELMKCLLGKRVEVRLTDSSEKKQVVVVGKLMKFDQMGEVVIQDDSGELNWCWPNLEIAEVVEQ